MIGARSQLSDIAQTFCRLTFQASAIGIMFPLMAAFI